MKAHTGVMMGLRLMANDLAHCFLEGKPLDAEVSVSLTDRSARKEPEGAVAPPTQRRSWMPRRGPARGIVEGHPQKGRGPKSPQIPPLGPETRKGVAGGYQP